MGHILNTLGPQLLVQLGINAHVLGAHRLLCELHHALYGPRGALLERAAVHALVHVDRILAGDDVLERRALAAGLRRACG